MKRIAALLILLGVIASAVVYNVRARRAGPASTQAPQQTASGTPISVSVATVTRGTLPETIHAVGVVRSDRQAAVTARVPGRIVDVAVREGSPVTAGQIVARLDLADLRSQVTGAEAGVEASRAQLRKAIDGRKARQIELDSQVAQAETGLQNANVKLQQAELGAKLQESSARSDTDRARAAVLQAEAGVKQAELALGQAQATLKRVEFLYAHGGVPRVEVEGARTQTDIARAQMDGAMAALRQAKAAEKPAAESAPLRDRVSRQDIEAARLGVRQAADAVKTARNGRMEALRIADRDIEAARAAVQQAAAAQQGARTQAGGATLTSPIAGVVTDLSAHTGEIAQPGQPLMTIRSTEGEYVEASVPARYASLLVSGAPVRIAADGGALQVSGEVQQVLPIGADDGRTVPVRIRCRAAGARLSPGLAVTVTISASSGTPRPLVASEAVRTDGDRTFVYVVLGGRAERRDIRVGRSDGGHTEVLSGLSVGDAVITNSAAGLAPGSRITETSQSTTS